MTNSITTKAQAFTPATLTWQNDPHCIALAERIAETLMQMDNDVIESSTNGHTTRAVLD